MEGDMLEDDGITAAIEELQSRLGDLQSSIDQALQVQSLLVGCSFSLIEVFTIVLSSGRSVRKDVLVLCAINNTNYADKTRRAN